MKSSSKGFTLPELLVTISIIALLTLISVYTIQEVRKRSRVAQRVADLKQVQSALELYYANNRAYPVSPSSTYASVCSTWGSYSVTAMIPGLSPTYIKTIPIDPQTNVSGNTNCYIYRSNGTDYAFIDNAVTELGVSNSAPTYNTYPELVDPARDGGADSSIIDGTNPTAWKVYSPGGITW
jgi:general secretion pathway protein G